MTVSEINTAFWQRVGPGMRKALAPHFKFDPDYNEKKIKELRKELDWHLVYREQLKKLGL